MVAVNHKETRLGEVGGPFLKLCHACAAPVLGTTATIHRHQQQQQQQQQPRAIIHQRKHEGEEAQEEAGAGPGKEGSGVTDLAAVNCRVHSQDLRVDAVLHLCKKAVPLLYSEKLGAIIAMQAHSAELTWTSDLKQNTSKYWYTLFLKSHHP
jgi:hypothetical protein